MLFVYLTLLFWLAVIIYWVIAAAVDSQTSIRSELNPLLKLFGSAFLIYLPLVTDGWFATTFFHPNFWTGLVGTILCVLGGVLSIWARYCLGRNWSGKVMVQREHRLIESGPYRLIRHPIYTGVLLMMLGASLVVGYVFSFAWLALSSFGLVRKSEQEEELMASQFPETYSNYRQNTKRLLPFIF